MVPDTAPCLACAASVPITATDCPRCGYDLARHLRRRRWFGALGTVLCLTVVLAPLGVRFLWLAYRHRLAAEGSVTQRSEPELGVHLRTTVSHHLGLAPPDGPSREASRARRDGADASGR